MPPRAYARDRCTSSDAPACEKIGQFGTGEWRIAGCRARPRSAFGLARCPPFGHPSEVSRRVDRKYFRPFITRCDGRENDFLNFRNTLRMSSDNISGPGKPDLAVFMNTVVTVAAPPGGRAGPAPPAPPTP